MYKIAFDVMGADHGVPTAINAAATFLKKHPDLKIIFVGSEKEINKAIADNGNLKIQQYEIFPTTEFIEMNGSILDLRRKKDASIVRALELVKDKKVDGMLTGGNSGAFLGGAHFILGEFKGIERPGFMPTWPTIKPNHLLLFLDAGANNDNTAQDLFNYAKMANIYTKAILKIKSPKIGLLNVGEEDNKGRDVQKEAFKLLRGDSKLNFIGNIEAREMISGQVDIIVTDGFSGNIALKSMEGSLKNLMKVIKESLTKTFMRKIFAGALKSAFKEIGTKFDYKNYAGAILLGVNGIVFKSHGSSDEQAFGATLKMTYDAVKNDVLNKIQKEVEQ